MNLSKLQVYKIFLFLLMGLVFTSCEESSHSDESASNINASTSSIVASKRLKNSQFDRSKIKAVVFINTGDGGCTGTLINPYVVVTAAHCIDGNTSGVVQTPTGKYISYKNAKAHKDYNGRYVLKFKHDIKISDLAYLILSSPINLKDEEFIDINGRSQYIEGDEVFVVGFQGNRHYKGVGKSKILYKDIAQKGVAKIDGLATYGDSGGPILNSENEIIGILSAGKFKNKNKKDVVFNTIAKTAPLVSMLQSDLGFRSEDSVKENLEKLLCKKHKDFDIRKITQMFETIESYGGSGNDISCDDGKFYSKSDLLCKGVSKNSISKCSRIIDNPVKYVSDSPYKDLCQGFMEKDSTFNKCMPLLLAENDIEEDFLEMCSIWEKSTTRLDCIHNLHEYAKENENIQIDRTILSKEISKKILDSGYKEIREFSKNYLKGLVNFVEVVELNINDYYYRNLREIGAEHKEAIEVLSSGLRENDYRDLRKDGIKHEEAIEVLKSGLRVFDYGELREDGANHEEAIEVLKSGLRVFDYGELRGDGAKHKEAIEVLTSGLRVFDYGELRDVGANHEEAIEVLNSGLRVFDYEELREDGASHEQAVSRLVGN